MKGPDTPMGRKPRAASEHSGLWIGLILAGLAFSAASGQVPSPTEPIVVTTDVGWTNTPTSPSLQIELVKAQLAQVEGELDSPSKAATIDALKTILSQLEEEQAARGLADEFRRMREETPDRTKELNNEIERLRQLSAAVIPTTVTLSVAERQLAVAEADLKVAHDQYDTWAQDKSTRQARLQALPDDIAQAKAKLADLGKGGQVSETGVIAAAPLVDPLVRQWLEESSRRRLTRQIQAWEEESAAYAERATTLRMREELVSLRIRKAEEAVREWDRVVSQLRDGAARQEAERSRRQAVSAHPVVAELAEQNAKLAEMQVGSTSPARRAAAIARELEEIRRRADAVASRYDILLTRFGTDLAGTGVRTVLLKEEKTLPDPIEIQERMQNRRTELADASVELLGLQDQREQLAAGLDTQVRSYNSRLSDIPSAGERRLAGEALREQLRARVALLDTLIADYERYLNTLIDVQKADQLLLERTLGIKEYINQQLFWSRAGTLNDPQFFANLREGIGWYADGTKWREVWTVLNIQVRRLWTGFVLVVLLIVIVRRWIIRGLLKIEKAKQSKRGSFVPATQSVFYTLFLALPIPLILGVAGAYLSRMGASLSLTESLGNAARALAPVALSILFLRQLVRRHGFVEVFSGWPASSVRSLRHRVAWVTWITLFVFFMAISLRTLPEFRWQESLGVCVVFVFLVCFFIFFFVVTNPSGRVMKPILATGKPEETRGARYVNFPVSTLVPLVLLGLLVMGYTRAAFPLTRAYYYTVLAAVLKWVVEQILDELALGRVAQFVVRRRAAALARPGDKAPPGDETPEEAKTRSEEFGRFLREYRGMIRWILRIVFLIVLWGIWKQVLPGLKPLGEKEVWRVALPGSDGTPGGLYDAVTLIELVYALIAILLTILLARNLPGLVELGILQRLPLDAGLRYAIRTLCRYAVVVIGPAVALGLLGIGWSKVHFLAAAVTVGLGFGLQEIFANFVSGLIILFERPLRVGDIVTVGDLSGRVTRIQMRATVIQDWDRRELLVPNKEIVTGRVINWSLSDTVSRVTVDVGVAYGSDTKLACRLMEEAAKACPQVMTDPPPQAFFRGFGESSLDLRLYAFLPSRDTYVQTVNDIHAGIDERFKKVGLSIPFPQRDVTIKTLPGTDKNVTLG